MSIYRKNEQGQVTKTAGYIVQRWNDQIFATTHSVVDDTDYYDIDPSANKYILGLTSHTEFQLNLTETNDTPNIYIRFGGQSLKLTQSNEEPILVRTLSKRTNIYTLDIEDGTIWVDPPSLNNYMEYRTLDDFPAKGTDSALYLARLQNVALEGEEEKWEDYNMLFRFDVENQAYVPVAGQGSGGYSIPLSTQEPKDKTEGKYWFKII